MSEIIELPFDPNDVSLEVPTAGTVNDAYVTIIQKIFGPQIPVYFDAGYLTPRIKDIVDIYHQRIVASIPVAAYPNPYMRAAISPSTGAPVLRTSINSLWRLHRYNYVTETLEASIQLWCGVVNNYKNNASVKNAIRSGAMSIFGEISF